MALIFCPECRQSVSDKAMSCPHCGFPLHSIINPDTTSCNGSTAKKKVKPTVLVAISSLLGIGCAFIVCFTVFSNHQKRPTFSFDKFTERVESAKIEYLNHPLAEPENGYMFEQSNLDCLAKLTVTTKEIGGCYIVLDPIEYYGTETESSFDRTRREMEQKYVKPTFYVRSGATAEISVPLGEYKIYYATGDIWYGEDHLFGLDTSYFECDGTFIFSDNGTEYCGWTLELIPSRNGNLETDKISEDAFPK